MLQINPQRFLESIDHLAAIGSLPEGGVRRLAFSEEDIQARQQIQDWMQIAGMGVHVDSAGNIIGRYPGKTRDAPVLATGSHIDTVIQGGNYDGSYGVLAGIEIARVLRENQVYLDHPFEVIVFTDEEGSMVGSKGMAGILDPHQPCFSGGIPIQSCLEKVGGDWSTILQARRSRQEIAAFVELHIEQGPILASEGIAIGIVKGIVGQRRFLIKLQGETNHAGTTPMRMRQDALVAAAKIILEVNHLGSLPGDQVATVGYLQVFPNTANTIPGQVDMSLDLRDLSGHRLDHLMSCLEQKIGSLSEVKIEITPTLSTDPALANPKIMKAIEDSCQDLNLSWIQIPSRAGHDAQAMAKITDMGMIFVPSQTGISHSALEYTHPDACLQGATVLLNTLLRLDQRYLIGSEAREF
jgi:N-carbamoyl-L-amino-acid hydrolase